MNANALAQFRRFTARFVLIAFAPFALDGCVSVGVKTAAGSMATAEPSMGAFEGRLYETPSDAKKDVKSQRPVAWKLFLLEQSTKTPLREGTGNAWTATDLPPGEYRVAVSWEGIPGIAEGSSTGSTRETFLLGAGESAQARVIVKKFPTGWVIGIGVLGAVLALLAATISPLGHGSFFRSGSQTVVETHSQRRAPSEDLETRHERE